MNCNHHTITITIRKLIIGVKEHLLAVSSFKHVFLIVLSFPTVPEFTVLKLSIIFTSLHSLSCTVQTKLSSIKQ